MTETAERAPVEQAADLLRSAQRIAVTAHLNPDADAIGSVLGLTAGLRALGKEVYPVLSDPVPEYTRFLAGAGDIAAAFPGGDLDLLVCLDAAGIDRIGRLYEENGSVFQQVPVLNVDHHRTNPLYGVVNFVDGAASSTAELVYRLLTALDAPIEPAGATALYFGLMGDTGSFRNGATTPGSLEVGGRLVRCGADVQGVSFYLFEKKTFAAARMWGRIIGQIELDRPRRIVFGLLPQHVLQEEGGTVDETEGVAEYLRGIDEADTVMLLKENPDGSMRVSMRSRPDVDVSVIASSFGGGGHRQAAGCTLPGPASTAREMLVAAYDRFAGRPA